MKQPQQEALFYETFNDALKAIVQACGGFKSVGPQIYPEKTIDSAQRTLSDALNENRSEKLSPDQVVFLLKLGRARECHAGINYLARESGYTDPQPIEPEDERARLQREFIEAQKAMSMLASKMERAGMLRAAA